MKLIIQIPCHNEERTLPLVLKDIPREIPGIDTIETQIIDDGSADGTVTVAREHGVNHIISYVGHKGLAAAFKRGLNHALEQGADILVNTDGDNQYRSSDIPRLVEPIVNKQADIVIGDRGVTRNTHFSGLKRFLQWFGSNVTAGLAGVTVPDAVSGFRAYNRTAMREINVVSEFSYVLDTTVQASKKRLIIDHVPIETNAATRPSRLFRNMREHIKRSGADLIRIYSLYEPFKVFLCLALLFILIGTYPLARFVYFYFSDGGGGHVQSLIFGAIFYVIGFQFLGMGILGEHMRINRKLIEDILLRQKEEREAE
jgi:glycosyltransferase involved in cell wall biosynthesis